MVTTRLGPRPRWVVYPKRWDVEVLTMLDDDVKMHVVTLAPAGALRTAAAVRWVGSYEVAYRIDPALLDRAAHLSAAPARYNIVVANKHVDKPELAAKMAEKQRHFAFLAVCAAAAAAAAAHRRPYTPWRLSA